MTNNYTYSVPFTEEQLLTYIELFAGIGGFSLGFDRAGMECVLQVEKDGKARAVLAHHWPNVPRMELVEDVTRESVRQLGIESIDVLVGGFPCQDLSVAGQRKGLAGERSGLWFEFIRVIEELRPGWIVVENVPGLLSSDSGRDMGIILDALEDLGYILDCDIMDAQYFGVPQRRRRVFIVCHHVSHLLRKRTTTSAQIILQCLIEILGCILIEARGQSSIAYTASDLPKIFSADGLKRRMNLFGIAQASQLKMLQENLEEESARCLAGGNRSETGSPGVVAPDTSRSLVDTLSENTLGEENHQLGEWNIQPQWKSILADLSEVAKSCITLTASKQITESKIYTCAKTSLIICRFIVHSNCYCPTYWSLASSALTVIKEYMNYARQTSNSLFGDLDWLQDWLAFIPEAQSTISDLERYFRDNPPSEIFLERESSPWDTPPSREKGQRVADPVTGSPYGDNEAQHRKLVAHSVRPRSGMPQGWNSNLIAFAPQAGGKTGLNVMEDQSGTLQENQVMAIAYGGNNTSGEIDVATACLSHGSGRYNFENETFITATIQSDGNGGGFRTEPGEHLVPVLAPTLSAESFSPTKSSSGQQVGWCRYTSPLAGVRRLTPLECERLQGFPDGHTDIGQSDSARYRQLGNAVCMPVAEWIGRRIVAQ